MTDRPRGNIYVIFGLIPRSGEINNISHLCEWVADDLLEKMIANLPAHLGDTPIASAPDLGAWALSLAKVTARVTLELMLERGEAVPAMMDGSDLDWAIHLLRDIILDKRTYTEASK